MTVEMIPGTIIECFPLAVIDSFLYQSWVLVFRPDFSSGKKTDIFIAILRNEG